MNGIATKPRTLPTVDSHPPLETVDRYRSIRAVGLELNHKLVEGISIDVLLEGATKLGMRERDSIYFNTEDESSVLMDYCIFHGIRKQKNGVERYLEHPLDPPTTMENEILSAMLTARFSIIVVLQICEEAGCVVWDILNDDEYFLADFGFSISCRPGHTLLTRVLFFDDFAMTGGAALPMGMMKEDNLAILADRIRKNMKVDKVAGIVDPASLIRESLQQNASDSIRYIDSEEDSRPHISGRREGVADPVPRNPKVYDGPGVVRPNKGRRKIGRNAACPCGSGKKYKHCCQTRGK